MVSIDSRSNSYKLFTCVLPSNQCDLVQISGGQYYYSDDDSGEIREGDDVGDDPIDDSDNARQITFRSVSLTLRGYISF